MRSLKLYILGTIASLLVGTASLAIVYSVLGLIGNYAIPPAVVVSTAAGSATAGAVCVTVGCLVSRRERSLLAILVATAVAALVVLSGRYANGSAVPPFIYVLAIVNGLCVSLVVGPLCRSHTRPESYLS